MSAEEAGTRVQAKQDEEAPSRKKGGFARIDKRVWLSLSMLGLLATIGFGASYAAFTATATNGANPTFNTFSTGSVAIVDDEASSVAFNVSNADQGATGSACIAVQYQGTLAAGSHVYLFGTVTNETNVLGNSITMAMQDGTDTNAYGTKDLNCTNFTANADSTAATNVVVGNAIPATAMDSWPTSNATGYYLSNTGSGAPAALWTANPTTVWYKFTYSIGGAAPGGSTVDFEFTWQANGQ